LSTICDFAAIVSSTSTSNSGKGLTGNTFKVRMLSETRHAVRIKELNIIDIEGVIQHELFQDNCNAMKSFLTKWSEILEDLRCAVLYRIEHFDKYKVSHTQPVIHRFIEGMKDKLQLAGSVAIDDRRIEAGVIVTETEFKSIMGDSDRWNLHKSDSGEICIPFTTKRDLVYSPLIGDPNRQCVHFEVKSTEGMEKGSAMAAREQVIGTNIVWAGAEGASFVRGMAINVFAASLVWFISGNELNDQSTTNGTHYIGSTVRETRDVVLQILVCLMDVELDQVIGMVEMESAQVLVIDEDGELQGFSNESVGLPSKEEEGAAAAAAAAASGLESKGNASGANARHVTDNGTAAGRCEGSDGWVSATASSGGEWGL
jgi:hypothetical protein